jgi:hypothetical protein
VQSARIVGSRDVASDGHGIQGDKLVVGLRFGHETQSLRVRIHFPAGNHQIEPLVDPLPPWPGGHRGERTEIAVPIGTLERGKTHCVEIEPCTAGKECGYEPSEKLDVSL